MDIPKKNRKEWRLLLTGDLNVSLKNFFFQMKVTQAKNQINNGKVSIENAIDEIYDLVIKFQKAKHMPEDIEQIFGKDEQVDSFEENINNDNIFDTIEESVKKEEDEARLVKEKQKKLALERIKMQEEKAKKELQKQKTLDNEDIRLEAQRIIEKRLEEERSLRKEKMLQKEEELRKNELREQQEKIRLKNATQRKKKTPPKKKSFWSSIFGK
jgi:hypothetical protein